MTLALLAGYMLFGNVMLLNLLIAIFTSVFEEIQANSKEVTISIIFEELRWPGVEMGDVQAGRGVWCSARSRPSSWLSSITLEIIITTIIIIVIIAIIVIITTRPKPAYGRHGLAGIVGPRYRWSEYLFGVRNVSLRACGTQLGFNQPGTINDNENPPGNLQKPWKPTKNHETTLKIMETKQKPWNQLEKPWKLTKNYEKPWNYLEKTWKLIKNHEKPWNCLEKPWKPTKNHETTPTRGHNWPSWHSMRKWWFFVTYARSQLTF